MFATFFGRDPRPDNDFDLLHRSHTILFCFLLLYAHKTNAESFCRDLFYAANTFHLRDGLKREPLSIEEVGDADGPMGRRKYRAELVFNCWPTIRVCQYTYSHRNQM